MSSARDTPLLPSKGRLVVLGLYVLLILTRMPELAWPGRFWAEEGTIYFFEAWTRSPVEVLTTSNLGYYSLYNKIACITAAHLVPLVLAPFVTMLFSLAAQVLPIWLLLDCRVRALPSRFYFLGAVMLVLLVQPNREVWLNTVNSMSWLGLATAIILVTTGTSRGQQGLRLGMLILSGLTGVLSCFLTPFFWIEYAMRRDRNKLHEALALTLACLIQAAVVLSHAARQPYVDLELTACVLGARQWVRPILGIEITTAWTDYLQQQGRYASMLYAVFSLLPYLVVGAGLFVRGRRRAVLLFAASLAIATISFVTSLEAQTAEGALTHLSAYDGSRYYFAPNVMLALSLLIPLRETNTPRGILARGFRLGCLGLAGLMLVVGVSGYFHSTEHEQRYFQGPSWPTEVEAWQQGSSDVLHIWPAPWQIELRRRPSSPK